MRILKLLDCKAMALGPGDLAYGHAYLQETADREGVKLVCANVVFSHNNEPAFSPTTVFSVPAPSSTNGERSELKVGVIGLVGPDVHPCSSEAAKEARLIASDPVEAACKYIPELRKQCDLLVLLGNLSRADIDAITDANPDVDAVFCARRAQQPPAQARPECKAVVFYGGLDLYKNLGVMNLELDESYGLAGGSFDAELLTASKYADHTKLKVEIAKIKAEVAKEQRQAILSQRDRESPEAETTEPKTQKPEARSVMPVEFVGAPECGKCHSEIYENWKKGAHALAFESLRKHEAESDYDCLPCHTTGYGWSSGFTIIERTPDFVGVQCESCHGMGSGHVQASDVRPSGDAKNVCISCHNDRRSPDFDEQKYLERIKHWKDD